MEYTRLLQRSSEETRAVLKELRLDNSKETVILKRSLNHRDVVAFGGAGLSTGARLPPRYRLLREPGQRVDSTLPQTVAHQALARLSVLLVSKRLPAYCAGHVQVEAPLELVAERNPAQYQECIANKL